MIMLVRHTRTELGAGVCYGRLDARLAPSARQDIARCLDSIPRVRRVIASPARRCLALAAALAARDGLLVEVDERLRELDFGSWEGRAWKDIPRDEIDRWSRELLTARPGGGESVAELWERVRPFRAALGDPEAGDVAVVSHAGPIRALIAQYEGRNPQTLFDVSIDWGECRRVT